MSSRQDQIDAPSHPPRTNLTTLPEELLLQISLLLDKPTALSLARVHPSLTFTARTRLWSDVDLSVNPHYGEMPLPLHEDDEPYSWLDYTDLGNHPLRHREPALAADRLHQAGLRKKVEAICGRAAAEGGRWEPVRHLKLGPRPKAAQGELKILQKVASRLRTLSFVQSPYVVRKADHWRIYDDGAGEHQVLEYQLLVTQLHLPMLTHVHLGPGSIQYAEILYILSDASPNLTSLDAHLGFEVLVPRPDQTAFPDMVRDSNIRTLRLQLAYRNYTQIRGTGAERRETVDAGCEDITNHPAIVLLRRCSRLERLILPYFRKGDPVSLFYYYSNRLFSTARKLPKLRELRWDGGQSHQDEEHTLPGVAGFPELELLVYTDMRTWIDVLIQEVPPCPKLQILAFPHASRHGSGNHLNPDKDGPSENGIEIEHMPNGLARGLLGCPELHTIRSRHIVTDDPDADLFAPPTDSIPPEDHIIGVVRSLRNGDKELLYIRIYLEREIRPKSWEKTPPEWRHFTEYEGATVPLEIIKKVLATEGLDLADWEGRGLEVGDVPWQVLRDWREDVRYGP